MRDSTIGLSTNERSIDNFKVLKIAWLGNAGKRKILALLDNIMHANHCHRIARIQNKHFIGSYSILQVSIVFDIL